jgi:hypothetical protein
VPLVTVLAVVSAIAAGAAFVRAASLHRQLKSLSQSYWELRYDFARLRARVAKIDGQAAVDPEEPVGKA